MKFRFWNTIAWLSAVFLLVFGPGCASEMSRGSSKSLYSIADTLVVNETDLGKTIQLRLDQKLMLNFQMNPDDPGDWDVDDYTNRNLLLLSDTPRVESGNWGRLFQARALGFGSIDLKFTPLDETKPVRTYQFSVTISR